jgi:hypothetical protein
VVRGALGLAADNRAVMVEIFRVFRPGGTLAFADITVDKLVLAGALGKVALWTDRPADGLTVAGW